MFHRFLPFLPKTARIAGCHVGLVSTVATQSYMLKCCMHPRFIQRLSLSLSHQFPSCITHWLGRTATIFAVRGIVAKATTTGRNSGYCPRTVSSRFTRRHRSVTANVPPVRTLRPVYSILKRSPTLGAPTGLRVSVPAPTNCMTEYGEAWKARQAF